MTALAFGLATFFCTLGCALLGTAQATSYAQAVACQALGGLGGGCFTGTVFATVSDHVPPSGRGRALGWVVTGQSLSLVLGVPLVTFIGSFGGWRGALVAHALATMLSAFAVWLAVPRRMVPPAVRRAGGPAKPGARTDGRKKREPVDEEAERERREQPVE